VCLQSSEQEHANQSELAFLVDLKLPYHWQWEAENGEIANEREDTVGHANGNQSIRNAGSWLVLVPEVRYRSTLEHVTKECGDGPSQGKKPNSERNSFEGLGPKKTHVED
jgi:hypothetical protein